MFLIKKVCIFCIVVLVLFACNQSTEKTTSGADTTVAITQHSAINPISKDNKYVNVDISPMDMSYFPVNYPQLKMTNTVQGVPVMRVIYSRPHLQGRNLFHDILKYGEMWRLGANEATELDLYQPVMVNGKKLNGGRYTLYCIPQPEKWTIVFNNNLDVWGLKPDSTKNILKVPVPVLKTNLPIEYFTIVFEKANGGANMIMAWQDVETRLLFKF
jgi:hypothetical protein